jgi:hypothetical protein
VREIADRYLPRVLSRRKKMGFPVDAFERMQISPRLFDDGFLADLYRLGRPALALLLEGADARFLVRLLMLESWGRLFFRDVSEPDLVAELRRHVSISPISL